MSPPTSKVKINVDLGEGYGNFSAGPDADLLPLIDYANVACGGHAGDPMIMQSTVRACKERGIPIGAHPGLPDVQGFGRRYIKFEDEELTAIVRYQVGALQGFLDAEGVPLHHVKPHGTLYGLCYQSASTCRAVYAGIPPGTPVFGLAGTIHEQVAKDMGLPFFAEAYGDVKYNDDGTLVIDRKKKPWTPEETKAHISSQLRAGEVTAVSGKTVDMPFGSHPVTLCCHSDSPGAVEIVTAARQIVDEFNREKEF